MPPRTVYTTVLACARCDATFEAAARNRRYCGRCRAILRALSYLGAAERILGPLEAAPGPIGDDGRTPVERAVRRVNAAMEAVEAL